MINLTIDEELEIIKLKNNGCKIKDIQNKYNIKSSKTIYNIIKRNGRLKIIPGKKYFANDDYFNSIDSSEKAYWLGFLYADGCVRFTYGRSGVLQLKLGIKDKKHLIKFSNCLESNYPIFDVLSKVVVNGIDHFSICCCVRISNTKIAKSLIKLGCVERKTFKIVFPDWMQNSLKSHFIRGYFDGDGTIGKMITRKKYIGYQSSLLGKIDFLESIQKILNDEGIESSIHKHGNIFNLNIVGGKKALIKFRTFLYKNSTVFLKRKKDIFDEIVLNSSSKISL